MRGTEKQIAWAIELINTYKNRINDFCNTIAEEGSIVPANQKDRIHSFMNEIADKMNDMYAGDVIDMKSNLEMRYDRYETVAGAQRVFIGNFNVIKTNVMKSSK